VAMISGVWLGETTTTRFAADGHRSARRKRRADLRYM
jgi:hypothetical protein